MFKIIFVLVINAYNGGMTTVDFTTRHQCETAKEQVKTLGKVVSHINAVCLEKQVPLKKTKCKIINDFSYKNENNRRDVSNLDGYPYPIALECIDE